MAEQFNLRDVLGGLTEAQKGGVFPEQTVKCKVTEAEYTISPIKGTKGWKYTGELLEGENQGETVEGTAWWSSKPRGVPFFLDQMKALGITEEMMLGDADGNGQLSNEQLAEAMVGAIFEGQVKIDGGQKNGRKRNQLIAVAFLGAEDDEAGEIGGGDDELDFSEFESTPAAAVDVSADDPEIAAAEAAIPPDGTAGDQPVDLPDAPSAEDELASLLDPWEPSTK